MLIGIHKHLYASAGTAMAVGGNATSDSTCAGHLNAVQGRRATLTVDYNDTCLIVYGINVLPDCKLPGTTNIRIERATP